MGRILIVTGMSGAGKTVALKILEDLGYYSIDNLPVALLEKFVEFSIQGDNEFQNLALGVDVRHEKDFGALKNILALWNKKKLNYNLLFLDAKNEVLVRRFKETRREHPLLKVINKNCSIEELIIEERNKIFWLKEKADFYLNTEDFKIADLKNNLENILFKKNKISKLNVKIISFGYKYGIPIDSDIIYDVRFLPNPYYDDKLRQKTGQNKDVVEYIKKDKTYDKFIKKLTSLIDFTLPLYDREGKDSILISIGCTGGKHRSVACAEELYKHINDLNKYVVNIDHRDINK